MCTTFRCSLLALVTALLITPAAHAQVVVNFEQASDLALFNTNINGTDRTNFAFAPTVGVGGTGGLTTTNLDTTAVYVGAGGVANPTAFDLTQPTSVSMFFRYTTVTGDRPIQIGFLSLPDASFNNDAGATPASLAFASVRAYVDGRVESQKRDLVTAPSTYGTVNNQLGTTNARPDLLINNYYKETYTMQFTNVSTGDFTYSVLLEDYGADGTVAPTSIFSSGPINDTIRGNTFTGGQGYAAVRQIAGTPHLDTFSVIAVPEPVSASLLSIAGLGLLATRRARR